MKRWVMDQSQQLETLFNGMLFSRTLGIGCPIEDIVSNIAYKINILFSSFKEKERNLFLSSFYTFEQYSHGTRYFRICLIKVLRELFKKI